MKDDGTYMLQTLVLDIGGDAQNTMGIAAAPAETGFGRIGDTG
jgi:hypothetical protein